jgi:RNA polymerase sigma-70 factor (ECF subfamily)
MFNTAENELVKSLKNGKPESFTFLFDQYGKKIYGLAYRFCGNHEDAEDIVQKTFLQALKSIKGFKGESSIYTWLYIIAKNLCLVQLRERKKSSFTELDQLIQMAKTEESSDGYSTLEKEYYIDQVKQGCLFGLLRCLSFYQRMAFILNVLFEIKVKDISIVLNKSETATRLLIHRAKLNLKNFLCKNCSLYDARNPCHCENLIHFSLKQGWIKQFNPENPVSMTNVITEVENEINSLKRVMMIFSGLQDESFYKNRLESIQKKLGIKSYKIFSNKKMK